MKRFNHPNAVFTAIIALSLCAGSFAGCSREPAKKAEAKPAVEKAPPPPPPVILVVIDALRADRLSQYGYALETSPALADLAAHSTVFTNCRANAPWTRSSMATVMTGLSPIRHGVTRTGALSAKPVTLAERLKKAGMDTVGISLNANVSRRTGFSQGFNVFEELFGSRATVYKDVRDMFQLASMWYYGGPKDSYFLFLQPMNVHGPYKVPKKRQKDLLGRRPAKGFTYFGPVMKDILKKGKAVEGRKKVTPEMLVSLEEKYDTAIRYTTDRIGRFFEFLKKRDYYDEALIIVTADHGEELFDHGGFSHGFSLYDELLHVPLFIKKPFQTAGAVVDDRVMLADLYPTILDILDLEPPSGLDGRSFADLTRAPSPDEAARAPQDTGRPPEISSVSWPGRCVARAIVDWPWKLIEVESNYEGLAEATFLFDIENDLEEKDNLAEVRADVVERLSSMLEREAANLVEPGNSYSRNVKMDEDMIESLKALGYLE